MCPSHLDAVSEEEKFLPYLSDACTALHDGDEEVSFGGRVEIGADECGCLPSLQGICDGIAPDRVDIIKAFSKSLVEGRHLRCEVADRAAVEEESGIGLFCLEAFEKSLEDALQRFERIFSSLQRFDPPVPDCRGEQFVQDGIAQLILTCEVMEQGPLGNVSRAYDPVDTPSLESMPIEFAVTGFQYLTSGPFWIAHAGHVPNVTYLLECCKRGLGWN